LVLATLRFAEVHDLTSGEIALVRTVAWGNSGKEVPTRLNVKPSTIATMWQRIFRRTGLRSQTEILAALLRLSVER
jgi:DNA-binding NarL/FixJ family response regulator